MSDDRPRDPTLEALRGLAGIAALGLGATYAWGGLVKMVQLSKADQSAFDTLPLVPLEQILLLGIRLALPLVIGLVAGYVIAQVMRERQERLGRTPKPDEPPFTWPDIFRPRETTQDWIIQGLVVAVNVVAVLFAPPTLAIIFVFSWLFLWLATPELRSGRRMALILVGGYALFLVTVEYFNPRPLPDVSVSMVGGSEVSGGLIASTSDGVMVATGDKEFRLVPTAEVDDVNVSTPERDEPASLFQEIVLDK